MSTERFEGGSRQKAKRGEGERREVIHEIIRKVMQIKEVADPACVRFTNRRHSGPVYAASGHFKPQRGSK